MAQPKTPRASCYGKSCCGVGISRHRAGYLPQLQKGLWGCHQQRLANVWGN